MRYCYPMWFDGFGWWGGHFFWVMVLLFVGLLVWSSLRKGSGSKAQPAVGPTFPLKCDSCGSECHDSWRFCPGCGKGL